MNNNSSNSDSTQGYDTSPGSGALGGFGYGIGLSLAIFVIFVIITYASYMCKRVSGGTTSVNHRIPYPRSPIDTTTDDDVSIIVIQQDGLDEATLSSYPKFTYSELKPHKSDSTASVCSICLGDYKETDSIRLLPDCGHIFHIKCIDAWLMLHPTCPICRTSPLPTPLQTPLQAAPPAPTSTL